MAPRPKVFLVGAGPGDPELITLRGREVLASSDVVVYDRLVAPGLLGYAPASAERLYVGKAPGRSAHSQEDINRILIDRARAGKVVCRLKGGDPFVFGRGGEEALALAEAGIEFEVVPGVTAGLAGPAYAGIPVTHRGLASSVTLVTGHEDPTKPVAQVDWAALAKTGGTIVVYMGVGRMEEIASLLIAGGLPPTTPAAVVASGTLPGQGSVVAHLDAIAERAEQARLRAPAVLVVGKVAKLGEQLEWFQKRPLYGAAVLVTRARELAPELSDPLRELGAEILGMPCIRLVEAADMGPVDSAIDHVEGFDWLLFTSARAVERFFERLLQRRGDVRVLAGVRIAAIGRPTAQAVRRHHLAVDLCPAEFVAEGLLEEFAEQVDLRGARCLLPRAAGAREVLPEGLRELGAKVVETELYRSEPDPEQDPEVLGRLAEHPPDVVTFASPSAVRGLGQIVPRETFAKLCRSTPAIVIGPVTADAAREAGFDVVAEATPHTIPGLIEAVVGYLSVGS